MASMVASSLALSSASISGALALTRSDTLAVRQAPEPGHDRGDPRLAAALLDRLARLAVRAPLRRHPGEIVHQEVGRCAQILGAPLAVAVRAFLGVEIGGRAIAVAGTG